MDVFVTFADGGKFNETYRNVKPLEYSFLGCGGGSYSLKGDVVRIQASCMSSTAGRLVKIESITSNQLILNPFGSGQYIFEKQ
ncbi:MAG: hypothetical protein MUE30_12505 [Spirosomaceae bacterium]|jgi:hypothetical protein|nr:hypothetical protein [Spirosomataceae bacterium]